MFTYVWIIFRSIVNYLGRDVYPMSKRISTENKPLTKKAFHKILKKASQPVKKPESDSKQS